MRRDGQHAVADTHFSLVEERRAEEIAAPGGFDLVETQRREDVPCRHLPHVLVARKPVGPVVVERRQYLAHLVGGLPRLTDHRVEVDDVVAGFVAVGVLTDQARDVGRGGSPRARS